MPDPYKLLSIHDDITLLRRPLPGGDMGRWYPEQRVIVLDTNLTANEERCTLMHELIHALQDESGIEDAWFAGRQERACHELVARTLIPLRRLATEARAAADDHQLADALEVDHDTLLHRIRTLTPFERAFIDSLDRMEDTA